MPISVSYLPEERIVLQSGSGDVGPAEIDQAINETRVSVHTHNPRGVVIDTRVNSLDVPMHVWIRLIEDYFAKIGTHVPTAYIIDGVVTPDKSLLLEITGFNNGTPVSIFATTDEAVDWIGRVAKSR